MTARLDLVVVGSHAPGLLLRVRRPPLPGETVLGWDYEEPVDGGKGSNQAIAAARLGGRVGFVGCLGCDRLGDQAIEWLQADGVETRFVRRCATAATGLGFILLDELGVPAMVTTMGANAELSEPEIERALEGCGPGQALLTQFEIPLEVSLFAARAAHRHGMLTIVNPAPAPDVSLCDLDFVDLLVPNESEAHQLLGRGAQASMEPQHLAHELRRACGAGCVIVTLGEQGIAGDDGTGGWQVAPPHVNAVDTSGAGDVFCAALALSMLQGQSVRPASGWACQAAALSVTRPGTIPAYPTRAEVDAFIGGNDR